MKNIKNIVEWWNSISDVEEKDIDDELINRLLRWKEIRRNLEGVSTILDIGGATGAFSIPLAKEGFEVTHVDISPSMLEVAREKARGISNINFIEANACNLDMFQDAQFDLVLNMDGAISFSGDNASKVISESCRVAHNKLIVTVSNRSCMIATWINYSLRSTGTLTPAVYEMLENGYWNKHQFPENEDMSCSIPMFKAFTLKELENELRANGMKVIANRSLGSLSHIFLMHLRNSELRINDLQGDALNQFIEISEKYDIEIMPDGPGSFRRSGIIAVAETSGRQGSFA
ncbi:class I SAM-dependent methyltransferase [Paenibacillus antibioticophila]|uniref:class I SAM-dependent methyltransferase n=1 Tax=Paenibacillus antibioticophila TaxID=1274374 RepID=UPI000677A15C|nr:methyltransferase domain-containing protein [Paenibacillus antibioticophila]